MDMVEGVAAAAVVVGDVIAGVLVPVATGDGVDDPVTRADGVAAAMADVLLEVFFEEKTATKATTMMTTKTPPPTIMSMFLEGPLGLRRLLVMLET